VRWPEYRAIARAAEAGGGLPFDNRVPRFLGVAALRPATWAAHPRRSLAAPACWFGWRGLRRAPARAGGTRASRRAERIAAALHEFSEAGADEVIIVADPITERSVHTLAEAVATI
jgi:hypothetical protein